MSSSHRYATLVGAPPLPTAANFRPWCYGYDNAIMTAIRSHSRTAYYFSNDGNDTTGDGSQENPWATVSKMNSTIAAADDVQCLLKRGDIWYTDDQLELTRAGAAVGAYGTGDNPILQQEGILIATTATWTLVSGTKYKTSVTLTSTTAGRLMYNGRTERFSLLYKESSSTLTEGEYYLDYTNNEVYLDIGADPSGTEFYILPVRSNVSTDNGIYMTKDMTWADSIDVWGFGLRGTISSSAEQIYGIKTVTDTDALAVVSNCRNYLFRTHAISSYLSKGIDHYKDCTAGWSENTNGDYFNFHNQVSGIHQAAAFGCVGSYGCLNGEREGTQVISGHPEETPAGVRLGLALAVGNRIDTSVTPHCSRLSGFAIHKDRIDGYGGSHANPLDGNRRDFIVDEKLTLTSDADLTELPLWGIRVNCVYSAESVGFVDSVAGQATGIGSTLSALLVNCSVYVSSTKTGKTYFGIWHNVNAADRYVFLYGSYIHVNAGVQVTNLRIDRKDNVATRYAFDGCIFVATGSATTKNCAFGDDNDTNQNHCVLYGWGSGYAHITAGERTMATVQPEDRRPKKTDSWYQTGGVPTAGIDFHGRTRNPTAASCGRFEPTSGKARRHVINIYRGK
jgi:hypothetical protein